MSDHLQRLALTHVTLVWGQALLGMHGEPLDIFSPFKLWVPHAQVALCAFLMGSPGVTQLSRGQKRICHLQLLSTSTIFSSPALSYVDRPAGPRLLHSGAHPSFPRGVLVCAHTSQFTEVKSRLSSAKERLGQAPVLLGDTIRHQASLGVEVRGVAQQVTQLVPGGAGSLSVHLLPCA